MVYKFISGSSIAATEKYQLANELHRNVYRNFKKRKSYPSYRDNIWAVDLADM